MKRRVAEFLRESGLEVEFDGVLGELVKGSLLTEAQAETLLMELAAQVGGRRLSVEERAAVRGVSKGAYARTRRQALENVRRSIYTVLLLRYLRVLGDGGVAALLEAAELLAGGAVEEALKRLEELTLHDITE